MALQSGLSSSKQAENKPYGYIVKMMHIFTIKSALAAPCSFAIGIPVPKGKYSANVGFCLLIDDTNIACHTKVTALWSDKSVRWLFVEGVLPKTDSDNQQVMLDCASYTGLQIKPKWVLENKHSIDIKMQDHQVRLSKSEFVNLSSIGIESIKANIDIQNSTMAIDTINIEHQTFYDQQNCPLYCDVTQTAKCVTRLTDTELTDRSQLDNKLANKTLFLTANFRFYFSLNKMDLQIKIHNPQPQVHHGGKWDLGNENSVYINSFGLRHILATKKEARKNQSFLSLTSSAELKTLIAQQQPFESLALVQHSSGGRAWNSPNHKLADNQVHLQKKGASCMIDAVQSDLLRATPNLSLLNSNGRLVIIPKHFWEKFPSSLFVRQDEADLYFNDEDSDLAIELQPGEIKSHEVHYVFCDSDTSSNIGLIQPELIIAPSLISASEVLPWFDVNCKHDNLQSLIDQGLLNEHNFFAKREALDEYGWRNFGDIYADHEAQQHDGDEPFVSHYNNQYDPLYGFLKQWLLSGEAKWLELADDLFDHLIHIDLYHTQLDKPEYNNGLFWHTDHYVQAQTATHRTYSKHQQADVYIDHAGGGGPGAHHCYSSGLALYYWLRGKQDAYTSMMGMMQWMSNIYEGDQTLLGLFLRIKNANHIKIPFTEKLLLGCGTGVLRNVFTNKYPLDRGTGNYVNVLLDSFELTQDLRYLVQTERVILSTISSKDNIADRNFDDIENSWFYVVFLQAVAKYLYIEAAMSEERMLKPAIMEAFLLYSDYIMEREAPYLINAERLEYPNDTWTAQDLRKVFILTCAASFSDGQMRQAYLQKANELQSWIENKLKTSNERCFTRILVLMMQNYGTLQLNDAINNSVQKNQTSDNSKIHTISMQPKVENSTWRRVLNFIQSYSLRKERKHLLQRIPKLQKWLGSAK